MANHKCMTHTIMKSDEPGNVIPLKSNEENVWNEFLHNNGD